MGHAPRLTHRKASDLKSTTRLAKAIMDFTYNERNHTLLNSSLSILSKKHGQLKATIQALVEQAMAWRMTYDSSAKKYAAGQYQERT